MSEFHKLTIDEILRLPPMIHGKIRWKPSLGGPTTDPAGLFTMLVEEHTPTEFEDIGGSHYVPTPGTGIWKASNAPVNLRAAADESGYHVVVYTVTGLHYTVLDGLFRITPSLTAKWGGSNIFTAFTGYRLIEPLAAYCPTTKTQPVQGVDFEVTRHSIFSGRRLP